LNKIPFPFELSDANNLVEYLAEKNRNKRNRNVIVFDELAIQNCGIAVLNEFSNQRAILGFSILPEFQNKGIATWVAQQLLSTAAVVGFEEVQASPIIENQSSMRVLEKLGFEIEEEIEEESIHSGIRKSLRWIKQITSNRLVDETPT
jgi:RimJ/RimL family protein N-acetyltransferase